MYYFLYKECVYFIFEHVALACTKWTIIISKIKALKSCKSIRTHSATTLATKTVLASAVESALSSHHTAKQVRYQGSACTIYSWQHHIMPHNNSTSNIAAKCLLSCFLSLFFLLTLSGTIANFQNIKYLKTVHIKSQGNSPICKAMGESVGWVQAWLGVWEEEQSCIFVLLLISEGEPTGLGLPLNGDWRD